MHAYIGTYTTEGMYGGGNGAGVVQVSFDPAGGRLETVAVFPAPSPSWLAIAPDGACAYACNEIDGFAGVRQGSVTAYAIGRRGALARLNAQPSGGIGPAHCSVHPSGRFLLVANFASGHLAVLPIRADGAHAPATDVKAPPGGPGPTIPAHAAPGSFAHSGHDASHSHMIAADPAGRFVLSNDLGTDRTQLWTLDAARGVLGPDDPPAIPAASAGAGPRHFAFHPSGRLLYNLYEESSELAVYAYDPQTGSATLLQLTTTLPAAFAGTNFASAIAIAADGRFLYTGNRLHNSIAIFAVAADGRVRPLDHEWTRGDYPNHVALDPSGRFLFACNRRSDQVTVFRRDAGTGALAFTGQYLPIGSPNMIAFGNGAAAVR